jgi:sugar/nucleoside kinase (ribokinase family)
MSLTVVGSIAFDSVATPFGSAERELGGSAVYAALAGAHFTPVRIVGPVGDDFRPEHQQLLADGGVDTTEIHHVKGAETFSWRGRYEFDLSVAHTEETALNVFDGWRPHLTKESRTSDVLFLAAMDPESQAAVHQEWGEGRLSALDTLGYWIEHRRDALVDAVSRVDIVLLNDQEARELTRTPMLLRAAREIASWGPRAVVIKLGEYGCALLHEDRYFSLPGYPLERIADPTGAGDAFAGGFLGYLDLAHGPLTSEVLRRAVTYGSVLASYCVEDFGARRIVGLSDHEVQYRAREFKHMTHFEHVPTETHPREGGAGEGVQRLQRPDSTPSTRGLDAPLPTAGTPQHASPTRTPGTESLPRPGTPLGDER